MPDGAVGKYLIAWTKNLATLWHRKTITMKKVLPLIIVAIILLIVVTLICLMFQKGDSESLSSKNKTMTRDKIAEYRHKLRTILNNEDDDQRLEGLVQLAKEVGAGYVDTKIAGISTVHRGAGIEKTIHQDTISESELVLNINNALQTETMIDMCNTAARNLWISIGAAIVAFLSALAAWVATVRRIEK